MMRILKRRMLLLVATLCLASSLIVAAQGAASPGESAETAHALRIGSGDLLNLSVFDTPELSGKLRVDAAGEIMLPVVGALKVAGMTADEAAVAVEKKFRDTNVLRYPHVSVFIEEYATQGVTVTGEVKNPGIYPLLGSHPVTDLISAAGGVTATASKAVTITHKSDPSHPEVIHLSTKPGSITPGVDIQPGDTISVGRAGVVYVVGDVAKPGGYLIEGNDTLTVLQALALAMGPNRTAQEKHSQLIRKLASGREEIPLNLKSILENKAPDIALSDGDILFVPRSGGKYWGYKGLESAIGAVSGAAIYSHL